MGAGGAGGMMNTSSPTLRSLHARDGCKQILSHIWRLQVGADRLLGEATADTVPEGVGMQTGSGRASDLMRIGHAARGVTRKGS